MTVTDFIWSGVLLSAIGVMGLASSSRPNPESRPDDNPDPSLSGSDKDDTDPEVERLRALNGVRSIDKQQNGTGIARQPNGVYGFTYAPQQESPLFHKKSFHSFEMHKLADGSVHIIGFVAEDAAAKLSASGEYFDLDLYPDPWESSVKAVSIPLSRIVENKGPSREPGNALRLRAR